MGTRRLVAVRCRVVWFAFAWSVVAQLAGTAALQQVVGQPGVLHQGELGSGQLLRLGRCSQAKPQLWMDLLVQGVAVQSVAQKMQLVAVMQ